MKHAICLTMLFALTSCGDRDRLWPFMTDVDHPIHAQLQKMVSVTYDDIDMFTIAADLHAKTGINIVVDTRIVASGINVYGMVLSDVRAGTILYYLARETGTEISIENDIVYFKLVPAK